ncbi:MAG: Holliday junction branch migration protein RuvA [Clostridia bacterium]|nr:Holliday junction branch migration protein RuvA [Clostridia bacterium]
MYSYIIGKITEKNENSITLENGGIGYEVLVSSFAQHNFQDIDGEVKVYTYYQQREDGVNLFGFYCKEEKNMFLKLITVSGIGPKMAITILSNVSVNDLCVIVGTEDVRALSSVKGVGKKTAERILIELKDKIQVFMQQENFEKVEMSSEIDDACGVLVSLGLSRFEAERLAKNCFEKGDSVEALVTKTLSQMRG